VQRWNRSSVGGNRLGGQWKRGIGPVRGAGELENLVISVIYQLQHAMLLASASLRSPTARCSWLRRLGSPGASNPGNSEAAERNRISEAVWRRRTHASQKTCRAADARGGGFGSTALCPARRSGRFPPAIRVEVDNQPAAQSGLAALTVLLNKPPGCVQAAMTRRPHNRSGLLARDRDEQTGLHPFGRRAWMRHSSRRLCSPMTESAHTPAQPARYIPQATTSACGPCSVTGAWPGTRFGGGQRRMP